MADALDSLFNNIYLSEQESKNQHEYLSNIKGQIFASEKELREIEQKYRNLREAVAIKEKRLSNREVTLKSLKIRNGLLHERIQELKSEKEILLRNQAELKSELRSMRNQFCIEAGQFDEEFGFSKKRPKPTFNNMSIYKREGASDLSKLPTIEKTNFAKAEMERDVQDLEEMDAFLFDVDFINSQLN